MRAYYVYSRQSARNTLLKAKNNKQFGQRKDV